MTHLTSEKWPLVSLYCCKATGTLSSTSALGFGWGSFGWDMVPVESCEGFSLTPAGGSEYFPLSVYVNVAERNLSRHGHRSQAKGAQSTLHTH